ncbi:MAG: GlsB/YeaQ/YmgE family stress response membrane protein [Spirochaetes bacterium]|nr:GlsB/YeaQ/YmgE family stress response membrane protein [Spirochaetota bacterium]
MTVEQIIIMLIVGLVAGWLAGLVWKGGGFGLVWNLVLGVAGSFLGGWLFKILNISFGGIIGSIVAAFVGALIILAIVNLIRRRR